MPSGPGDLPVGACLIALRISWMEKGWDIDSFCCCVRRLEDDLILSIKNCWSSGVVSLSLNRSE